ncbi:MAG: excinuclease ABC subunit UvrB [Candidatus Ranarchaeia archaeon]
MERKFELVSSFDPRGDQPQAIEELANGINNGEKFQTLLGVTGSGKTYSLACAIEKVQRPTIVISHNKTLAAQLYAEFKEFFPNNAVEYFVSYYDYFQPEAYVPKLDLYIEKETSINEKIEQMRMSAILSALNRRDVIVVASVSCIFGAGNPEVYRSMRIKLEKGADLDRDELLKRLIRLQYERNDFEISPGVFRAKGSTVDIFPSYDIYGVRVEFFGDEIEDISIFDTLTGKTLSKPKYYILYPATNYAAPRELTDKAADTIELELDERLRTFYGQGKLLEAQRLEQRTKFDIEMLRVTGTCNGVENYTRHFTGKNPGEPPYVLLDYFPKDFLMVIDESHVTVPQLRAMYKGNLSRKESLVKHGFRLPSALDNRPLKFSEYLKKVNQLIFVSATPSPYEKTKSSKIIEQIVRPTGLIDPKIEIHPIDGQIDHLVDEINERVNRNERILVTTLTKKMAENLAEHFSSLKIKTRYLHSEVHTLDRIEILRDLRLGKFNVLVGINLLREGLDLPEVSLVAILDADKAGFLRSETSLIQTMGRASRNINGKVILYANQITDSMKKAISETKRRRIIQEQYNKDNNITPKTIQKPIRFAIKSEEGEEPIIQVASEFSDDQELIPITALSEYIDKTEIKMLEAAEKLEFELAAKYRDRITELKSLLKE